MSKFHYVQQKAGENAWKPVPVEKLAEYIAAQHPQFHTVLSVSALVSDDMPLAELDRLRYAGPFYADFDAEDVSDAITNCQVFCIALEQKGLDLHSARIYATGGRGFHVEVPQECFLSKVSKTGIALLPLIYKQMAMELYTDTLDLRVYSMRRGRMWRTPNVVRDNGHYKVQISPEELNEMTPETYSEITSSPRAPLATSKPAYTLDMSLAYEEAAEFVGKKFEQKRKRKRVDLRGKQLPSLEAMLNGDGIRSDKGFHEIALQLAIVANSMGWSETELADKAVGLCAKHSSDGRRYNTEEKRRSELIRMHRYMQDNVCYDVSVPALQALLAHQAQDLSGIPTSADVIAAQIKHAEEHGPYERHEGEEQSEYGDVASIVELATSGVYVKGDDGQSKRICAVSFQNTHIFRSITTGDVVSYSSEVLVNGVLLGRQSLELEIFTSLTTFNRYLMRLSHAMQGTDAHVRGVMLRMAEQGKLLGKEFFTLSREGLDLVSIPMHPIERLRQPFLVWCDGRGVQVEPSIREAAPGVEFAFHGFPDPQGNYKTDLALAPRLAQLANDPQSKGQLKETLRAMLTCQKPDVIAKYLGWMSAAFYRMLFHKCYSKFPLLHVNGPAGSGKTEMALSLANLFYYDVEPKNLTPGSTLFSITQHLAGSASIPLILDEYKPHVMPRELHDKFKLYFRDMYNCREVTKGGGTRGNDDYRMLYSTQLAAPMVFIAEAAEEEAAVMERIVLITLTKPPASVLVEHSRRFHLFQANRKMLASIGQYMAASVVQNYSTERLREEFDPLFDASQRRFMLTKEDFDRGISEEELKSKQGAKERTVFNYTVVEFGLKKFSDIVGMIFPDGELEAELSAVRNAVYDRMSDLLPATVPEWVKVLNVFASMAVSVDATSPMALRSKSEYAILDIGGSTVLELSARICYNRYRMYCRQIGTQPLYPGEQAFIHALKDIPGFLSQGPGRVLQAPGGVHAFELDPLLRMGFDGFTQ